MTYDVFLSHNSREKPIVERLALDLREAGLQPWLDKWCVTPGGRWQDELAAGLRTSRSCAVFVGPHDAGDWEREEVAVALDHAAKNRGFRVFLVLLPGVAEPFDPSTLSPFLSTRTWVDLRHGVGRSQSLQALINAVRGVPLAPPSAPRAGDELCPYRGLQAFDEEHAELYFGREAEIQRLVEQLKASPFLAVLGPSGSGKSSLVRAGLMPALRAGALPGSSEWPVRVFTPGADPVVQLAAQLSRIGPCGSMSELVGGMAADVRGLQLATALALGDRPSDTRVVWVVDQFEEVFTLCRDEQARTSFIANLLNASTAAGRSVVVITLRADFYHRCAAYPDLAARIAARQILVSPMDEGGLRQAIEEPARLAVLEFEEGLVDTLVSDVGTDPAALPLLEHSLLELWQRRLGRMLTLEGYRASGGLHGAIAQRAESTYAALDEPGRATSRRMLLRLTQVGEGSEDTRRRAPIAELVTRPEDAEAIDDVVRQWVDARLLTTTAGEDGERWVTVSHEALIRAWPRLRGWIDEDRAGQRLHRQITDAALDWRNIGRDESGLLRGVRLAQAVEFRSAHDDALNEMERAFLDASVLLQRREAAQRDRRRRNVVLGLSAGMTVALALAGVALWQWRRAEVEQRRATVQALNARSDLLRSYAQAIAPGWPDFLHESSLLAIEARALRADATTARGLLAAADSLSAPGPVITLASDFSEAVPGFSGARDELAVPSPDRRAINLIALSTGRTTHTLPLQAPAKNVVYSPRGTYVAIFTEAAVELWDLRSSPRAIWTRPNAPADRSVRAFSGVFSPDERTVAWIADSAAVVSEVATGNEMHRLTHTDTVQQVTFSADGTKVASAGGDAAQVLSLSSGVTRRIKPDGGTSGVSLDEHGRVLATFAGRIVTVWDVATGDRTATIEAFTGGEDSEHVGAAALDPTGARLGVLGEYGTAVQFSVSSGKRLWAMDYTGDDRQLGSLSPPFVAAKTAPGIELWNAVEGRAQVRLLHAVDLDKVEAVFYSGDTSRLVLLGSEHAWVYDTRPGSEIARTAFEPPGTAVRSGDGSMLAVRTAGGLAVIEAAGGRLVARVPAPPAAAPQFSRDGGLLLLHTPGEAAAVLRVQGGSELWRRSRVSAAGLSANGKYVGAVQDDAFIVWELSTGGEVLRRRDVQTRLTITDDDDDEEVVANVQRIEFTPDGDRVALKLRSGDPRGWRIAGEQELSKPDALALAEAENTRSLAPVLSADGRWRAETNGSDVVVTDNKANRRVATVRHDADPDNDRNDVRDLQFSADSRYLLTGSGDRTIRVWDLTGQELTRIPAGAPVMFVAFSPDARQITALTTDGLMRTWMWQDADLAAAICQRLKRNLTRGEWQTHFGNTAYSLTCPGLPRPDDSERR